MDTAAAVAMVTLPPHNHPMVPVLLDTDPGNDIDDALAIAYLLAQPACELIGMTTVSGNTAKRAAIAEVLCRAAGREDIPIVAGREGVLLYGRGQIEVGHYERIAHLPHSLDRRQDMAIDFLRRSVRERPGEITLLSIGPLSNIALLFALDPEIPSMLKSFVSMAGSFGDSPNPEWNCLVDPVAMAMAANCGLPHRWLGLNVTLKCRLDRAKFASLARGPVMEVVSLMAEDWFSHSDHVTFHDPLAAASLFDPSLCNYCQGMVTVDCQTGVTTFEEGAGLDSVAIDVDSTRFFDHYERVVCS